MEQMAVVKSVQSNGMAQVSVRRTTACAHDCDKCAGCEQLNTRMENTVLSYNDAQASPGDLVRLQSENATFFKTAAIVYVLPLVLALVTLGVMALLLVLFYALYLALTPAECLQPDQLGKLWDNFGYLFTPYYERWLP